MLNAHDEFQDTMNRKVRLVANGEKITSTAMNPVMAEKVTEVIRQIDESNGMTQNFNANQRSLKMKQIETWVNKRSTSGQDTV